MWKRVDYSSQYMDDILKMSLEQYGPENDISNSDYLQHQYFNNPSGDAVIALAVDRDTGTLAGQYIVCPMTFQINGKRAPCVNSLNTLTREIYRGQGVFTGLAESVYHRSEEKGFTFCYGMPNPNSYPGFIKKLNFIELCRVPLMLRPISPSRMVSEFLHHRLLGTAAKLADPFFHIHSKYLDASIEIVQITHDNLYLVNQFWEAVKRKYLIMNIRNSKYVQYRYLDMPRRKYSLYIAVQNKLPVSFAVERITKVAGMKCGMLVDFLYLDGNERAANQLLTKLLFDMQEKGASLAGCLMLSDVKESELLRANGFFRCPQKMEPQPFPLILRVFDDTLKKDGITNIKNWFFTMGDYDAV